MALSTTWFDFPATNIHVNNRIYHGRNEFGNYSTTEIGTRLNYGIIPYLLSLGLLVNNPFKESNPREKLIEERTGPFKTVYQWKQIDYLFENEVHRNVAITNGEFVQEMNLPLGIEVYKERMFISLPVWKSGVPATLTVLPIRSEEKSPLLAPYPNWSWHVKGSCNRLTSVFRMQADSCDRLWVLDSGQINISNTPEQICPPAIFLFDLETDRLILKYDLPRDFVKQDSLYSNIIVDVHANDCAAAHAYLADVWRFGLVVYSLKKNRSWRITDHLFFPDPLSAAYNVNGLEFEWTDGIFGFALSSFKNSDRTLFFNPMSSFRQFHTRTSIIRNETGWSKFKDAFKVYGQSRGRNGQQSACAISRNDVLFFGLVTQNAIGCWDTRKVYKRGNLGIVAQNHATMVFPNDLKIDREERESVWIVTNKLPFYIYDKMNAKEVNFRVMTAYVDEAIKGTVCDPKVRFGDSYTHDYDECF